jgi:hypothetical protein
VGRRREEMTQTLYAQINKRKKLKLKNKTNLVGKKRKCGIYTQ